MKRKYKEAIENQCLRQEFVEGINLECADQYIEKVEYKSVQRLNLSNLLMATLIPKLSILRVRGIKSIIEIYPCAFDEEVLPSVQDFFSLVIDHEGYHAKEIYERPEIIVPNIFYCAYTKFMKLESSKIREISLRRELRALENQLDKGYLRGISKKYELRIKQKISNLMR